MKLWWEIFGKLGVELAEYEDRMMSTMYEHHSDGYIVEASGDVKDFPPANGKNYTSDELQQAVEGYFEVIRLHDGFIMILNEEGKLHNLPVNPIASMLLSGDYAVGDVLICKNSRVR